MTSLTGLVEGERANAWLAWGLVAFLAVATVESLLTDAALWGAFAALVAAVAVLPAVVYRDPRRMIEWEVLALATLPVVARSYGLFTQVATYVAVAALALIAVAEIDRFSEAEMEPWFAVAFVAMTTATVAAGWAVARWLSDRYLGTEFLTTATALMWDLVIATAVGLAAGALLEFYVRRSTSSDAGPSPEVGA